MRSFYNAGAQRSLCLSALFVHACMEERRNEENGGEPVKVCRRVVGASVGLWMSPVNCVCVCVCVSPRHSCGIMGCTKLLAKDVAVLAGASASGFMDGVGCMKWCGYHSILAQVSWDTQMLKLSCACTG